MRRLLVLLLLAAAACSDAEPEPDPEALQARANAARAACLARELHTRAEDDLETLQAIPGSAQNPAFRFQEVYTRFAELRLHAAAHADSALNHAATPADSLRYAERVESYATRPPEPGTIDANVRAEYARDFAALAADPDHPCNWE